MSPSAAGILGAHFARFVSNRLATNFAYGSSPSMADGQEQFYEEQAGACDRAAASAQSSEEKAALLKQRDSWLALAKMIAPRRFGPGLRNFGSKADAAG